MRLGYFERIIVALGLVALVGIWYLFQPLTSKVVAGHAAFPSGLVGLLWVGQLLFWSFPRRLKLGRESFLSAEQERLSAAPPSSASESQEAKSEEE